MDADLIRKLEALAQRARGHVLDMAERNGCFAGAALSAIDLIAFLYGAHLRVTPASLGDPDRDYFLLSKGHAVPALYAVLAELGFLEARRFESHASVSDVLYWHPNSSVPGVEFHSGSLGHLLSVGMGIAYDARLKGSPHRVFVLLGDGELDEGSVWEGLLVASALRLANLTIIVDRNGLQANLATEALVPLEPLAGKLRAFGLDIAVVDGHSFLALERAFEGESSERPRAILAHTVRGKGIPSLEGRPEAWFLSGSCARFRAELAAASEDQNMADGSA